MRRAWRVASVVLWIAAPAHAQSEPSAAEGASSSAAGTRAATAGAGASGPTFTYPGVVAPLPPGGVLGGGNVENSSSRPITGNERDGFDLGRKAGGGTVYGGEQGNILFGGSGARGEGLRGLGPLRVPSHHTVKTGDTLWDICDYYFRSPYEWPRIWALNPQIKNPHWIEPGELVRLQQGGVPSASNRAARPLGAPLRSAEVSPGTLFLRDEGLLDDDSDLDWGFVEGAREERLFLGANDEAYVRWSKDREVKVGTELVVFRAVQKTKFGTLAELQGRVRIDEVHKDKRTARARVLEVRSTIERGARLGPVPMSLAVVPRRANDADAQGVLFASLRPGDLLGQGQIVYVDLGEKSGIKPGNTLTVVRKGDGLLRTMPSRSAALRLELAAPQAKLERIERPKDDEVLKDEETGTLRVLAVGKRYATCYAQDSRVELEAGDRVILRKGD